jgi:hypothetical protein
LSELRAQLASAKAQRLVVKRVYEEDHARRCDYERNIWEEIDRLEHSIRCADLRQADLRGDNGPLLTAISDSGESDLFVVTRIWRDLNNDVDFSIDLRKIGAAGPKVGTPENVSEIKFVRGKIPDILEFCILHPKEETWRAAKEVALSVLQEKYQIDLALAPLTPPPQADRRAKRKTHAKSGTHSPRGSQ